MKDDVVWEKKGKQRSRQGINEGDEDQEVLSPVGSVRNVEICVIGLGLHVAPLGGKGKGKQHAHSK